MRIFGVLWICLLLGGCGSFLYDRALPGEIDGRLTAIWVGPDQFVYVPIPWKPFFFDRTSGYTTRPDGKLPRIQPGLMYTDGGSIPRVAQIFPGFSPWRVGPAYLVHDWVFHARGCLDAGWRGNQFDDVSYITDFDESAKILAEAIKTLGLRRPDGEIEIPPDTLVDNLITRAVDSSIAQTYWKEKKCKRVTPYHIATIWKTYFASDYKLQDIAIHWKLHQFEIDETAICLREMKDTKISPDRYGTPAMVSSTARLPEFYEATLRRTPGGCLISY